MSKKHHLLELSLSLTICFLPIFIGIFHRFLYTEIPLKILPSIFNQIFDTPRLLIALTAFVLITLTIHLVFGFLAWLLWTPLANTYFEQRRQRVLLATIFFVILQSGIFSFNLIFYPQTSLGIIQPMLFAALSSSLLIVVIVWHSHRYLKKLISAPKPHAKHAAFLIIPFITGTFLIRSEADNYNSVKRSKPDLIIIGFDSLRPDHLRKADDPVSITPYLDTFLEEAYSFTNAYTPMARTYPAWMSILTGRYPTEHGTRFNLINRKYLKDSENSLPFLLKNEGYMTAYAIDETRFSNIDEHYGFDFTVTPSIGAADFLLGDISDIPLNNLFNFTPYVYAKLFPYQYINRAVHKTYTPELFDTELENLIAIMDNDAPLFLVTHYELPHWPFDWHQSLHYAVPENPRLAQLSPIEYQKAVHRADKQFGQLMEALKRYGRLDNAIVVVLSDHGEGFNQFAKNLQAAQDSPLATLPPFALHGINVLDEAQTRVLLAFRSFGKNTQQIGKSQQLTSLVDVAPTLLSLAGIDDQNLNATGCDLFERSQSICLKDRIVFTESGFYVSGLGSELLDQNKIASEAYAYYDVNLEARLTIKSKFLTELLEDKQRAAISDQWIVASVPQQKQPQFLIADLTNHEYWRFEQTSNTPLDKKDLWGQLCLHYQNDDRALDGFCDANVFEDK